MVDPVNNETFRDKLVPNRTNSESAAPDGVLTRAGRRPPTAEQREQLVASLLTTPHFGKACEAAGLSRAAGYRLMGSDPEVKEAVALAREVYLRDLLDAVYVEAVEGRAPIKEGEPVPRIRDNRLLAAALRTLLGSPAVAVNVQQNNGQPAGEQLVTPEAVRERIRAALQGRVLDGTATEVPADDGSDLI